MKKSVHVILIAIVVAGVLSTTFIGAVHAQSPAVTDEQINRIRANCISAKNSLSRLRTSDTLLRVNRGQIYESMVTKLMERFNSRVQSNQKNGDELVNVTQNYLVALTTFRADYKKYEEQLSLTLKIDCTKEPVAFYDATMNARLKRTQVHVDVVTLHQYIDAYKTSFDTFVKTENLLGQGVN